MEFPELGDHCSLDDCNELDFLPFKCQYCNQVFCRLHCQPLQHHCQHVPATTQGSDNSDFKHPCSASGCRERELVAVLCPQCRGNYCLQHRHPPDHACESLQPQPPSVQQMAHQKVQAIAEALPCKPKKRAGHKDPKLAAKVQLMKLKMKAVTCGKPLEEERCYLLVVLPLQHSALRSLAVCVAISWTVGKALDAIADAAKVSNRNNVAGEDSILQLYRHYDGSLLPATFKVSELLSTDILCNGETVILEVTPRGQGLLSNLEMYAA